MNRRYKTILATCRWNTRKLDLFIGQTLQEKLKTDIKGRYYKGQQTLWMYRLRLPVEISFTTTLLKTGCRGPSHRLASLLVTEKMGKDT